MSQHRCTHHQHAALLRRGGLDPAGCAVLVAVFAQPNAPVQTALALAPMPVPVLAWVRVAVRVPVLERELGCGHGLEEERGRRFQRGSVLVRVLVLGVLVLVLNVLVLNVLVMVLVLGVLVLNVLVLSVLVLVLGVLVLVLGVLVLVLVLVVLVLQVSRSRHLQSGSRPRLAQQLAGMGAHQLPPQVHASVARAFFHESWVNPQLKPARASKWSVCEQWNGHGGRGGRAREGVGLGSMRGVAADLNTCEYRGRKIHALDYV